MMGAEENKAVVRRYLEEVWNQGRLAAIDELVAPTFVLHDNPYPDNAPGPAGVRQLYAQQSAGFPDQHYTIEDIFAEGDRVAVRATFRFTHRVAVAGAPPTGKRIAVRDVNLYRVVDGRIVEQWWAYDVSGMLEQLGVRFPSPGENAPLLVEGECSLPVTLGRYPMEKGASPPQQGEPEGE